MIAYLLFFFYFQSYTDHPIHVSVSEVEIKGQAITWSARIYKDDLLLGMYGKKASVKMLAEPDRIREDILRYLTSNVSILIDEEVLTWTLVDLQPDPEAIWITVTAKMEKPSTSLTLRNHILLNTYRDQKNVVNLQWDAIKKNLIFENGRDQHVISM